MATSAQLICIALFITLALGTVSAQVNGTATNSGSTNNTSSSSNVEGRLQCYKCSSFFKEQHCDNPSEGKTQVITCEAGENMCRKVEQHINYDGDDHVRTYRDCAKTGDLGECSERTGTFHFKSWYCQCKGRLCNSATRSAVSFTLLVSIVATFLCLKNRI